MSFLFIALLGFVQNAIFTAVSRSRNSGDVVYHFWWAIASNAVWFIMQAFVVSSVFSAIKNGSGFELAVLGAVYVASTATGSAAMMWFLLKTEKGKRKVGG